MVCVSDFQYDLAVVGQKCLHSICMACKANLTYILKCGHMFDTMSARAKEEIKAAYWCIRL